MVAAWHETDDSMKYGVAIYNFRDKGRSRLELDVGDSVHIVSHCEGWYCGFAIKNRTKRGIFPKSFICIKEAIVDRSGSYETVVPKETPIVGEITAVLREWGILWKGLYMKSEDKSDYDIIQRTMLELIDYRSLVISHKLTVDELKEIQQKVTNKIDMGNARLGLDLVVRDERGNVVDPLRTSTVNLYRLTRSSAFLLSSLLNDDIQKDHQLAMKRIEEEKELMFDRPQSKKVSSFNLYVNVKHFVCRIGENADILLTLYDAKEGVFISENYVMKWGNQGMPKDMEMLNNLRVLFSDLSVKDAAREKVFLVCQIIRIGRMDLKEPESKKHAKGMRRPFGVAALDVTDVLKGTSESDEEKQNFIPFLQCGDRDFMDKIIKQAIAAKDVNHKGQGLWVTMRKLLGDLTQVQKEYQHLVTNATSVARKMGFPDVIMPGDIRNDLYVNIIQGEFRKGGKVADKNVEVTMVVCNQDGEIIPNVISEGAGGDMVSQYKSIIYYHEDHPKWCETVKLAIPISDFYESHVKFMIKHRSTLEAKDRAEKPFAMSYIKLMNDDGTTVGDGQHELLVYRIDTKKTEDTCRTYFTLPSRVNDLPRFGHSSGTPLKQLQLSAGGLTLNPNDNLQICTLICSTKLTHNVDLMGLLKWRENPANLEQHLKKFMTVDGEEVVKFLQDTLDTLFNILMENSQSDLFDNLVFEALIFLLGLVSNRKYSQFRPVLDVYIKENFSATLAYNKLMVVLKFYIEEAQDLNRAKLLLGAMRSLEYIFKFIVRSRLLFSALNENRGKQQFELSLQQLFASINKLMKDTRELIVPSLEGALQFIPTIISDVMAVYSPLEFSSLLVEFLNSVPRDRLRKQKLLCINDIVHSPLFLVPECRRILLPEMLTHLKTVMWARLEIEVCVQTLGDIMDLLFDTDKVGPTSDDLSFISFTMFRTVIQTSVVMSMDRKSPALGSCVAVMTSVLRQMTEQHYTKYIASFETPTDLMDFLKEILQLFKELVTQNVYPADWSEMIMLQNWVFLNALHHFSNTVRDQFTNPFEYELWSLFFNSSIAFVTQRPLQLDKFSVAKRNKIIKRYQDMRCEAGFEIRSMWYNLGQHKVEFIPDIVGPIVEMALIPEAELRKKTVSIFFDMMQCEFMSYSSSKKPKRSFLKFEQELISRLDELVCAGHGDEDFQELFYEVIKGFCDGHMTMRDQGTQFVDTIRQLMQLLLEYRAVAQDENRENRMSCTVGLLNFYHDINRNELYIRYLNKLCDLHVESDNFTEAAYTLMLYAKQLRWSDEPVSVMLSSSKYPDEHTHRQLKEALYYEIISYFDKGKMWEKGIELCKELASQYELDTFDYTQLSVTLRRQAELYDSIMTKVRPEPEYFRVGYYGLGFPSFLRNRVFIYRGKEYERLTDFQARLQNQFPNAVLMKYLNAPTEETKQQPKQFLQVNKVTPIMELNNHLVDKRLNEQILKYFKVNEVQKFTYSRKKDENINDLANLWLERTNLVTPYPLPGILRWFPVTSTHTFQVSPLELAIEVLDETNQKIRSLIDAQLADPNSRVDPLGMVLNGVVDAAVNGGISNYKVFYSTDYAKEHTTKEEKELLLRLRHNTTRQLMILSRALEIHKSKCPESLQPFQAHMEQRFNQMKAVLEKDYGIKLSDEDLVNHKDVISVPAPISSSSVKRVQTMPASRHQQSNTLSIASRLDGADGAGSSPRVSSTNQLNTPAAHHSQLGAPGGQTAGGASGLSRAASSAANVFSGHLAVHAAAHQNLVSNGEMGGHRNSTASSRGSTNSLGSGSGSKIDIRDGGAPVVELSQELTPQRPLRPDIKHGSRLTTAMASALPVSTATVVTTITTPPMTTEHQLNTSRTTMTQIDYDESPPPLPEKSSQADYANIANRVSGPTTPDGRPLLRRDTHRDKPQPPPPTTPTQPLPPKKFFEKS